MCLTVDCIYCRGRQTGLAIRFSMCTLSEEKKQLFFFFFLWLYKGHCIDMYEYLSDFGSYTNQPNFSLGSERLSHSCIGSSAR